MPLADGFDARRLSRWARALRGLICYSGYPGRGRPAHGDASGPLFSGGRRHAEFHPRGGTVPCLAASADPRDPAARRGAWRPVAAPRAQADPPDRFRQADRTASAPDADRCRGRQIDCQEILEFAAGADPPRRHVHNRAGTLHGLSRRLQQGEPGMRADPRRGRAGGLSRMLMAGELDLAVMAQPEPFSERLDVWPLYRERFGIAFPTGHRLETQNRVRITDVAEETYLRRINCEYRDYLADRLSEQ